MNRILILFGFTIRILVSFWNSFFGPSFGAEADALGFHESAKLLSLNIESYKFEIGPIPYYYFLSFFYKIFSNSLFVGSLLSTIFWLFSAQIFLSILKILNIDKKYIILSILIYCFLPTSILYTSVTLREVYQLFFSNLVLLCVVNILIKKSKAYWILLILSLILMGLTHGALTSCSFLFFFIFLYYNLTAKKKFNFSYHIFICLILFLLVNFSIDIFKTYVYEDRFEDGLSTAVMMYQSGGFIDARAQYRFDINLFNLQDLFFSIPIFLFQYLFEPFPWHISTKLDLFLFFENIIRFLLIIFALNNIYKSKYNNKKISVLIIIFYFLSEIIWSLGTINWGTASRHHIPSIGILIISAFLIQNYTKKPIKTCVE